MAGPVDFQGNGAHDLKICPKMDEVKRVESPMLSYRTRFHSVIPGEAGDPTRIGVLSERSESKELSSAPIWLGPQRVSRDLLFSSNRHFALRLGFNFVKGLRSEIAGEIIAQRLNGNRQTTAVVDCGCQVAGPSKEE